jgi:hypothetical protein
VQSRHAVLGRLAQRLETAFRGLGRIAKLEVFETKTFPPEDVKVFWEALVVRRPSSTSPASLRRRVVTNWSRWLIPN